MKRMPIGGRLASPNTRQVRARAHRPQLMRTVKDVIAGNRSARSPAAPDVATVVLFANLLRVAVDAALIDVDPAAAMGFAEPLFGVLQACRLDDGFESL